MRNIFNKLLKKKSRGKQNEYDKKQYPNNQYPLI